jgi:hypothetical protein
MRFWVLRDRTRTKNLSTQRNLSPQKNPSSQKNLPILQKEPFPPESAS